MIWAFVPKHNHAGTRSSSIEIATFVAVSISNEGCIPILKILDVMGITIGPVAMRLSRKKRNSLDDTKNFISQESKTLEYHLQCSSIGSQFRLTWSSIFGVYILTKDNGNDGGDIVFGNYLPGQRCVDCLEDV